MKNTAVLVIAHGSPHPEWVAMVEKTVQLARLPLPVRTAYLSGVLGRSIPEQIDALECSGFRTIMIVPLFVSKGSTHVDEIKYMLHFIKSPHVVTSVKPIRVTAQLIWCEPLEMVSQVQSILDERLQELTTEPDLESLLIVGHGSDVPGFREEWERMLGDMVHHFQRKYRFKDVAFATLRPDTIARQARRLTIQGRLLVLPAFVSEGYFTQSIIPSKLHGIPYTYSGKTYLPHPLIADWIRQTVLH